MHLQSAPHDWTAIDQRDISPAPTQRTAAPASPSAPAVTVLSQVEEFPSRSLLVRWPQVALDGCAAVPVVASDPAMRRYIARILQRHGYKATGFAEPQAVLGSLAQHQYDVAVLSGHLGNLTWCSVIREVRPHLPILLILQGGDSEVVGRLIDAGVDCFEAPFLEADLVARTKLLFRAAWRQYGLAVPGGYNRFRLDVARSRVKVGDSEVTLTDAEYRTLWFLVQRPGAVSQFSDIEESVWGKSSNRRRIALRAVIRSLRRKLSGRSDDQSLLRTERCIGYRLSREF